MKHPDPAHLRAPPALLQVWRTFDAFPMETLTKAWVFERGPHQRSVEEMEAHRAATGASGNCFDLALWLQHRLHAAGLGARVISDDIADPDAHVAVLAEVSDRAWLCDLGDLWAEPIAIDHDVTEPVRGFFPAADVTLTTRGQQLEVCYLRHGGKLGQQAYDLRPVSAAELRDACALNQRTLALRLVEMRLPGLAHWEYEDGASHLSTHEGLQEEPPAEDNKAWAERIALRTGMRADYALACLEAFERHAG